MNGWKIEISDAENPDVRDEEEAASLYRMLTGEIIPLFYEGEVAPGTAWLEMVRHNWRSLGPFVSAARMVNDYDTRLYRRDSTS